MNTELQDMRSTTPGSLDTIDSPPHLNRPLQMHPNSSHRFVDSSAKRIFALQRPDTALQCLCRQLCACHNASEARANSAMSQHCRHLHRMSRSLRLLCKCAVLDRLPLQHRPRRKKCCYHWSPRKATCFSARLMLKNASKLSLNPHIPERGAARYASPVKE